MVGPNSVPKFCTDRLQYREYDENLQKFNLPSTRVIFKLGYTG